MVSISFATVLLSGQAARAGIQSHLMAPKPLSHDCASIAACSDAIVAFFALVSSNARIMPQARHDIAISVSQTFNSEKEPNMS
eukprot:2887114-Amphidinium_carterae.1